MEDVSIVGAGLVGSLWASYLVGAGYRVSLFESRSDPRKASLSAGKSINLALSTRGWRALRTVGVANEIEKIAIPMYGRMIHNPQGTLTFQPYGKDKQAIYSISRAELNIRLLNFAKRQKNIQFFFDHSCCDIDLTSNELTFFNKKDNTYIRHQSGAIFGCDGAFSAVRYYGLQRTEGFNFSQHFIEDGYREILLPAHPDGTHKLEKNALHIWPRGRFMLIAIPNHDGSFTCTLFMPHRGGENSFDKVNTPDQVDSFFRSTFPDFYELMPQIAQEWENHPLSSLAMMRSNPWHVNKTVLMGDAAHATVPFYGQGMNAGFEDCSILWELMQKYAPKEDEKRPWNKIFEEYSSVRKPNGDALQELSMDNYLVMRDRVADTKFLIQKKIEAKFSQLHPEKWIPLYSQVTFSEIPYAKAHQQGKRQSQIMEQIMDLPDIEKEWDKPEIIEKMVYLIQ